MEKQEENRKKFKKIQKREAQARATKKYIKEKTDDIRLRVAKGTKELWKEEAEKRGMSMTKFVKSCVEKEIKNGDMLMF